MANLMRRPMVRRAGLAGPNVARQSSSFLYSANYLPVTLAVGSYDYFTVGVGTAGQGLTTGLTYTDTNLQTGRRIPDQSKWAIRELGFAVSPQETFTGVTQVLANGYLSMTKPGFIHYFGPPLFWPAGCGVSGADTLAVSNGWPTPTARVKLKTPIILSPGETFAFQYNVTTAQTLSNVTTTWILLFGETVDAIVD